MRDRRRRSLRPGDTVHYTVHRWDGEGFALEHRPGRVLGRDGAFIRLVTECDGGKTMTMPARALKYEKPQEGATHDRR